MNTIARGKGENQGYRVQKLSHGLWEGVLRNSPTKILFWRDLQEKLCTFDLIKSSEEIVV